MQILNSTQMNKPKQKFGMVIAPEGEAAHLLRQLIVSTHTATVDAFEKAYSQVEKSQAENKLVNIKFTEDSTPGSVVKICLELVHKKTDKVLSKIKANAVVECEPPINGIEKHGVISISNLEYVKEMLLLADKAASKVEEILLPREKTIFNTEV